MKKRGRPKMDLEKFIYVRISTKMSESLIHLCNHKKEKTGLYVTTSDLIRNLITEELIKEGLDA